ncbi:hypothetical protein [Proteiniborus sp. MB09-C3]|uniref:putative ABC transporter permease n=1 Tax=Proteiniborus sp. MB09-C3 TaxID=3050072 RepID=UPI0025557C96|nr:hypothetical protein [Proteiniborus sp. MB09-C3]WIV10847.1 hypothetical protein QO263_11845 [Proteiniborus sp. MB09-C3]
MLTHFVIYGLLGMLMEVFWTGMHSLLSGNLNLISKTSIWMFFIYGSAVFLEPIHDKIRRNNIFIRGITWVFLIYTIEFLSGFLLEQLIGSCPWDYKSSTTYTLRGYIRFDYFPAWFIVGLIFEKAHDFLDKKFIGLT